MSKQDHPRHNRGTLVHLGLGSNLGRRRRILARAVQSLGVMEGIRLEQLSSLYETEPEGQGSNWYLNLVVRIETESDPRRLLRQILDLERRMGRDRSRPWPDRELDIDILLWEDEVITSDNLIIPHPRMHQRLFVLVPLAEMDPSIRHPVFGTCVEQMIRFAPAATIRPAGRLTGSIVNRV